MCVLPQLSTSSITFPITRVFGPTDGLINVDSATWGPDIGGPGTHLGTLHGADQCVFEDSHLPTNK